MTHDHRPGRAEQRAALATARAILDGADHDAARQAAESGCPACVAVAGISFMVTVVSTLAGDKAFVSERSRRAMLAAVDAAEAELRGASN